MKKIFKIFGTDMKKLGTNWAALLVIGALMILPSLYAWFNILASWDPYGNTGGLKVAVVNKDKGTTFKDKDINVGNELVDKLKNNTKLGWLFVSEDDANEGVRTGKYYAMVTVPEEFSKQTVSILDKKIERPKLLYKVNQKSNAIAPKITDKGVNTIKSEVDTNIIETVDGTIFKLLNEAGLNLENSKDDLLKLINGINEVNAKMPEIEKNINDAYDETIKGDEMVNKVKNTMPLVKDTLDTSNKLLSSTKDTLDKAKTALDAIGPVIKRNLQFVADELSKLNDTAQDIIDKVSSPNFKDNKQTVLSSLDNLGLRLESAKDKANADIKYLTMLAEKDSRINGLITPINNLIPHLTLQSSVVEDLKTAVATDKPINKATLENFKATTTSNINELNTILQKYDTTYTTVINDTIAKMQKISDNGTTLVNEAISELPKVTATLDTVDKGLLTGKDEIAKFRDELPTIKDKISKLSDKLSGVNDAEKINNLLDMLKNDWQTISNFLGSPVEIEQQNLYELPNYGSAMTPFYTTLAAWVGALLMVSLLTTEPHHEEDVEYKPYQKYFGKLLFFMFVGIVQALILSLGDLYILKTFAVRPALFIGVTVIASIVFTTIVYTLVSIFGNVGKVLAIILLVLQVGGSGGTFPIEVTPPFFRAINPFLPFTHSISAMRETVAGVVWQNLFMDLGKLGIYFAISIPAALLLKKVINKASEGFVHKLEESNLTGH